MPGKALMCKDFVERIRGAEESIKQFMNAPVRLISMIESFITELTEVIEEGFKDFLDQFEAPDLSGDIDSFIGMFDNIVKCPVIKKSLSDSTLKQMQEARDILEQSRNWYHQKVQDALAILKESILSTVNGAFTGYLEGHILGILQNAIGKINKFIDSSVISSAFKSLDELLNCVQGFCEDAQELMDRMEKYRKKMQMTDAWKAEFKIDKLENISQKTKEIIINEHKKVDAKTEDLKNKVKFELLPDKKNDFGSVTNYLRRKETATSGFTII